MAYVQKLLDDWDGSASVYIATNTNNPTKYFILTEVATKASDTSILEPFTMG